MSPSSARASSTADGRAELSFGRMIGPLNELRQKRLRPDTRGSDPAMSQRVERDDAREQWPDWVSGACLLVRRRDAEAVGLLDERYFMYTEDVDFCAAIRARGRRILFTPDVEIVHLRGRSAAAAPGGDPRGLSPQPPRVLREAPPLLGAAAQLLSAACAGGRLDCSEVTAPMIQR